MITRRGQVSIPARLRREMHLEPGQTVRWEKVSATECRPIAVFSSDAAPDPVAALLFAREHDLEEASSEAWLAELRSGERD